MSLLNKSFKNNQTGEVVRIIDSYQNIAVTEKKERIDANRLLDSKYFTEYIDPKSFFQDNSTYNLFAEKIKNVDLSKIPDDDSSFNGNSINMPSINGFNPSTDESAVVMYDPEDEKAELMRKYGATDTSALTKQNQAFSKILGDDAGEVVQVNVDRTPPVNQQVQTSQPLPQPEVNQRVNFEDPIITMFKNAKKNVDFSIDLKVEGKIPRIDFIEMMEDSYEISIIEFLADEFTNDLLKNPSKLKMKIISELKKTVYPNQKEEIVEEVKPVVDSVKSEVKPKAPRGRKKQEEK
jgi:hypothetical protein